MSQSSYEKLMRQIAECQQRSRKTLLSIDSTLLGVKQTLHEIEETNNNIDKLKNQYTAVMEKLCMKIAKSFTNFEDPFKYVFEQLRKRQGVAYENLPQEISEEAVVQKILQHKQVLILTGAGVSADSGIPTFRGKNGIYSNGFISKGKTYTPEQYITYQMFKESPEDIWAWIDGIYKLSIKSAPNQIHRQIDILAKNLSFLNKRTVLATQNIDDLHIKPINKQYQYYNIHGNCKYVRCDQHHFETYNQKTRNGKCKVCGQNLRPHILFFDQKYGKDYGQEIMNAQFPLVICIGSSLKTGLAIGMVQRAQQVIQINPQPVIQIGKVYRFTNNTAQVLKKINSALLKDKK